MRILHLLPAVVLLAGPAGAADPGERAELTRVEQVRALTPEQARQRHPVRLTGVVTYFDGAAGHAFIQDQTGAVFFRPGERGTPGAVALVAGEQVEVSGVTWAGAFSPSVAGRRNDPAGGPGPVAVRHLGAGVFPAPVRVPFDQLKTGRWHDQLVEVRATVREYSAGDGAGPRALALTLSGPEGRRIAAWGMHLDLGDPADWLDREVRLMAVVAGGGDPDGRLKDVRLLVGDSSWVLRDDEALQRAFTEPPRPIDGLRRYQPPSLHSRRSRVDGTISLVRPGEGFFLTSGPHGLWVGTLQQTMFEVGDVVRVAGFPGEGGLSDGIVRIQAHGPSPAARLVQAGELAAADNQGALVSVEGVLRDVRAAPDGVRLELATRDGTLVRAGGVPLGKAPAPGARVLVTGVVETGQLQLRDARDVVVLEPAPWLTGGRRNVLLAAAAFLVLAGVLWLVSLRRQVARQTLLIREQVVHGTRVEERQRLARDLHDSLEQHLVGLHLQIDTLRERIADAPEPVRDLAAGAARMLDHCRDEARRSVCELRTQTLQREGLAAALVQLAAEADPGGGPRITTEVAGESTRLDPGIEFHLLRCAQEAVANALKHAKAREVAIRLHYLPGELRLLVSDDGAGFDPALGPAPGRPRFGLLHLRERAARIMARLAINSAPGRGTTITLTVPMP